eukprot:SAG11_NODE_2050_length_3882_cov_13.229842_5_plen_222_part_00
MGQSDLRCEYMSAPLRGWQCCASAEADVLIRDLLVEEGDDIGKFASHWVCILTRTCDAVLRFLRTQSHSVLQYPHARISCMCFSADGTAAYHELCGGGLGLYGVKFFLNGKWVTTIVDSLIPCTFNGRWWSPIFAGVPGHGTQQDSGIFIVTRAKVLSRDRGQRRDRERDVATDLREGVGQTPRLLRGNSRGSATVPISGIQCLGIQRSPNLRNASQFVQV